MGLLDYSKANPWLGDALATLSQGLLAYGSGNQNAMAQLPQMLAERQRYRQDSARQARLDERDQKLFDLKIQEAERTANADAERQKRFSALLPTLPPELQGVAQSVGPDFADLWAKQQVDNQFPKPAEAPTVKDFYEGDSVIQKQWNPATNSWDAIGQGPRWAPKSDNGGIQVDTNGDGVPDIVIGGKGMKPPTEAQTKSANQYTLLGNALTDVEDLLWKGGISPLRMAGSDTLSQYGPLGQLIGQAVMSPDDKQFQAARAGALESLANSITGAAFTEEQKRNFIAMLPQATDDSATSKAKLKRMRDYLAQLQRNAGSALPPQSPQNDLKSKYGLE